MYRQNLNFFYGWAGGESEQLQGGLALPGLLESVGQCRYRSRLNCDLSLAPLAEVLQDSRQEVESIAVMRALHPAESGPNPGRLTSPNAIQRLATDSPVACRSRPRPRCARRLAFQKRGRVTADREWRSYLAAPAFARCAYKDAGNVNGVRVSSGLRSHVSNRSKARRRPTATTARVDVKQ